MKYKYLLAVVTNHNNGHLNSLEFFNSLEDLLLSYNMLDIGFSPTTTYEEFSAIVKETIENYGPDRESAYDEFVCLVYRCKNFKLKPVKTSKLIKIATSKKFYWEYMYVHFLR